MRLLKVPRNFDRPLYKDYTNRETPRFSRSGGGEGTNFIPRSAVSRNSLHKTVGDIRVHEPARAGGQLPGMRSSALKIRDRAPPAEIDGRAAHTTCNYNYKSLGKRDGHTRAVVAYARDLATASKFIRRRAIRNLNMQPVVFMHRCMQEEEEREREEGETRRGVFGGNSCFFHVSFSCDGENY